MSLNHHDFSPEAPAKRQDPPVPPELYGDCRLLYVPHFGLDTALREWAARFGA